jgi:hypothetical protein
MDAAALLERVLDDEGLTAGLDEPEATALIQAVTARVRALAAATGDAALARRQTEEVCRVARAIARTAATFRDAGEAGARAVAAQNGLPWPRGANGPGEVIRRLSPALDRRPG